MFPTFADILASDSTKAPPSLLSPSKIFSDDGAESTASGGTSEPPTSPELPSKLNSETLLQTPQSAATIPTPATCPPGLPSAGSVGHASGQCSPCCFHPRGRCVNGQSCSFCHFGHEKRRRKKRAGEWTEGKDVPDSQVAGASPTTLSLVEATSPSMSNLSSLVSTPCVTPMSTGLPASPQRAPPSQPPPCAAPAYPAPNMEPQGVKTAPPPHAPPPMYPPVPAHHPSSEEAPIQFPGDGLGPWPRSPPPTAPPCFGMPHQDVLQKVDMNIVPAVPPGLCIESILEEERPSGAPPGLGLGGCPPPGFPPSASAPPSNPAPSLDALLGLNHYSESGGLGNLMPVDKRPAKVQLTTTICAPVWLADPKVPAKVPVMGR